MASTLSIILLVLISLFFQMTSLRPVEAQGVYVEYYPTRKMGMTAYGNVYCPSTGAGVSDIDMSLMCSIDGDGFYSFGSNTTDSDGFFNITRSLADLEGSDYTATCYVEYHLPTARGNCADFYTAGKSDVWSFVQYQGTLLTANWGWVEKQIAQNWDRYVYDSDVNPVYYPLPPMKPPVPSDSSGVSSGPTQPLADSPTVSSGPMQASADSPDVSASPVQAPVESPHVSQGIPQAPANSPQVSSTSPSQASVDSPALSPSPMEAPDESQDDYDYYYPTRKMGISAYGNVLCSTGNGVPDIEMSLMCSIDGDGWYSFGKNTTDSDGRFNVTASVRDLRATDYTTQCYIEFHVPTTRGNCEEFHKYTDAYIWSFFDNEGTFETANWGWVEKKIAQNWNVYVNQEHNGPPSAPSEPSDLSPSPMQTPAESPEVSMSPTQDSTVYPPVSSSPSQSIVESPQVSPSPMQTPVESTMSPSPSQAPVVSAPLYPSPRQAPTTSPSMSPSTRPVQAPAVSPVVSSSPTPAPAKVISNRAGISAYGNVYCSSTGNKPGKRARGLDVNLRCPNITDFVTIGHTTTNSAGFFNITLPGSDLTAFSPNAKCYVYFDVPTKDGNCQKFHTAAKSLIRSDIKAVRYEQTAAYGLVLREKAKRWYISKTI